MKWRLHVLSLEIRKALAYRTDFWVQLACSIGVHVGVAYFLWKSIFEFNNITQLGGYQFESLMLYYFMIPFITRITHAQEESGVAREIYDGGFNKYLVYPIDLVSYKFMGHIGYGSVTVIQLIVGLAIAFPIFGVPGDIHLTWQNFLLFIPLTLLSSYIIFIMMFCLELVAFWADTVWSLVVMLRLAIQMFGGSMIPVEMFPPGLREANNLLPFQYGASIPLRALMGKMTVSEITDAFLIGIFWAAFGTVAAYVILRRGLRSYTGVGI